MLQVKLALAQAQVAERGEHAEALQQQLRQAESALDGARRQLRERDEDARSLVAGLEAALQATRTALEAEAARNKLKVQVRLRLLVISHMHFGPLVLVRRYAGVHDATCGGLQECNVCVQELQRSLSSSQQQVKQLQDELAKVATAREADTASGPLGEVALMQVCAASCQISCKPPCALFGAWRAGGGTLDYVRRLG